jgi:hypothetical protein
MPDTTALGSAAVRTSRCFEKAARDAAKDSIYPVALRRQ